MLNYDLVRILIFKLDVKFTSLSLNRLILKNN